MLTTRDQGTLDNLKAAQFDVIEVNGARSLLIKYAHLSGRVYLTEFGITYGTPGHLRDWTMTGPNGEDCTGAMKWAVEKTKDMIRAEASRIIARFEAVAALPDVVDVMNYTGVEA